MARKKQPVGADAPTLTPEFLASVGGSTRILKRQAWSTPTALTQGGETSIWDFGWIPEECRDAETQYAHQRALDSMPRFAISGTPNRAATEGDKADLCSLWKHPDVIADNGSAFTGIHQITGSCVGAGGGNMWMTLACVERVRLREAEFAKTPFWLLPYGRSRFYCGMKTPGEGSLGSCFADAAIKDGTLPADTPGLPTFTRDDGYTWGRNAEMAWSDGDAQQTLDRLPQSRQHLIKTAAKLRSASDVREALFNGYPVTCASMYAHDGGKVQGSGSDAVLLARRSGSWSHQMSILAAKLHPQFGWIYWLHNQWGLRAHGICPSGMPHGGVYIVESDVDWICRDEVYAFSGNNGFPAPVGPLDWIF